MDHVVEAERRILGNALQHSEASPRVFDLVADRLSADDFEDKARSATYAAMAALSEDGEPINLPTVLNRLRSWRTRDQDVGPELGLCVEHCWPRYGDRTLMGWVGEIRRASRLRKARKLGEQIATAGADAEVDRVVADAYDGLVRLAVDSHDAPEESTTAELDEAANALLHADASAGNILRVGLLDVDAKFTAGLAPRTLTVIAALTSRGKTSLAMQFGDELAARLATRGLRGIVRVFSLEMGAVELHKRRLIAATGIPLDEWEGRQSRRVGAEDRLAKALTDLKQRPLRIMYGGGISIDQIRAVSRKDAATSGLALVIVDYLQALEAAKGDENREREVARMARGLKALSMDLDVPVLALAQLNRSADQTERPSLSQLRESGAIEQYADNVCFIYQRPKDDPSVLMFRVGKQRNGARDVGCRVFFRGPLYRFENLARGEGDE